MSIRLARFHLGKGAEGAPPPPPPEDTKTVIDSFTGTDGTVLNTATWMSSGDGDATRTIQNNRALLTRSGGYAKSNIRNKVVLAGGEVGCDVIIDDKTEHYASFWACGQGPDWELVPWSYTPRNGYWLDHAFFSNDFVLKKSVADSATTLGTYTVPGGVAAGDIMHLVIKIAVSGVQAFVWKNDQTRPAEPQITSTDTTYTSGYTGAGLQTGGDGTLKRLILDNFYYDDYV